MIPRRYQIDAVNAAISYLQNNEGNPVVVSATGTGKSVMIASLCDRIIKANADANILVCTHVGELVAQNAAKLRSMNPTADIGICSASLGAKDINNKIVFATIGSIYRVPDLSRFKIVIVDEAHTISRKEQTMWGQLFESIGKHRRIGFTATDFRLDSGSLTDGDGAMFDDVCFEYGLGRAIQDGYLCRLVAKETKTKYDVSNVGKVAGEFNLKELQAATNVDSMTRMAVDEMIDKGELRSSWLVFCNGVEHSFAVRDELRRNGIEAETVTGDTPDTERDRILEDFKAGRVRAVTNNAVWTTGVDIPNVDMIAMLRHTLSAGLLLQMAGRGTRAAIDLMPYATAKDRREAIAASVKPDCLFLDFAGNITRHGPLDLIKAKAKGKKGDGVAPVKACPDCASLVHASAAKCPDCGHEFPKNEIQSLEKSYAGNILSGGENRDVSYVEYFQHNVAKEGKTPCIMVKYHHPDGSSTKEYVCIKHEGFAKQKAAAWWKKRNGEDFEGHDLQYVVNFLCPYLKRPSKITVVQDGKYERIKGYDFSLASELDTDSAAAARSFSL